MPGLFKTRLKTTVMTGLVALLPAACVTPVVADGAAQSAPATTAEDADLTVASTEEAKFKKIYTEEWAWRQQIYWDPDSAKTPAHLAAVSAADQQAHLEYWLRVQGALEQIDAEKLPTEVKDDYAVYVDQIDNLVKSLQFREYQIPLNSAGGFWTDLNYITENSFASEDDYKNYLRLMRDFPRYFDEQIDNMRAGLERGFTQPQVTLEGRDVSIAAVADADGAEQTAFYKPFAEMPEQIPEDVQATLREEARTVIATDVIPSYGKLLTFFRDEYYPGARKTIAAYDLPGGKAFYDWRVKKYTTLDQTPDEVHQTGLREVAKIRGQMQDIMEQVGFEGTLREFLTYLRTDPQFYADTPEDYLKQAAWYAKKFDGVVPKYFGQLPRTRFGIKPFPPEIAPFTTGAAGGRETFWLNTYRLDTRPLYSLAALTLHESAPGHSFQMSLAAESDFLPDFRRDVYISAYGEGWALYCEKLGVEMGMYETPYDVFGMLSYQMWRAARLVVDTGLHSQGWSREQAVEYLLENTAIGEHEIRTEVDRYITDPGQAVSYYTGQLAIEEARGRAEAALGEKFDIRAFHDTVLSLGSVPLPVLQNRIDRFISDGGVSPFADETDD